MVVTLICHFFSKVYNFLQYLHNVTWQSRLLFVLFGNRPTVFHCLASSESDFNMCAGHTPKSCSHPLPWHVYKRSRIEKMCTCLSLQCLLENYNYPLIQYKLHNSNFYISSFNQNIDLPKKSPESKCFGCKNRHTCSHSYEISHAWPVSSHT